MTIKDTTQALGVAVAAGVPVLLWGPPGTGKTSVLRALAESRGLPCEVVIASIREPSDFAGLPIVTDGGVHFAPPLWAKRLAEAGGGLLVLDEISTAPPAVQAALLRVVLERVVGDLSLPSGVAVVAAANPPEQASDGWDLTAPLANRFCHLDWRADPSVVAEGLVHGFGSPAAITLGAGIADEDHAGRALVAAFLLARPSLVCVTPTDAASAGRAWPSPRTWEMTATLWAAATSAGVSASARAELVRGAVGDGAGAEFLAWVQASDLPDPEALLADPDSFTLPTRPDQAYAVLAAVAAAVAADPTEQRWAAGWRVLGRAVTDVPDVAVAAARTLARCRPDGAPTPPEANAFIPVLAAAGLLEDS